ncbi:hypothetical protein JQS43_19660 [Natronosporangium hydrolyticum]|uniref:Uncharacterized protein n=1 Tax=Natronosporangium hydrolyticum TaxID=2811111 RepID=A0A895YHY9_9ACTN|nr:hypothetical protein [Natronosporangium hydrolyticum]QSB13760.1 hypothetical protein JQS43_19660 [Natronosporangium hydrolyticum]
MWLVAIFFTVAAATGWYMVRQYWRQSDKFFQQRETFRLVFQSRWLSESFMRTPLVVAVTCTLIAVSTLGFAISGSPETASGGTEVLLWSLFILFFAGCFVTIVLAPLIIFFNKPSLMVAPHDRGKPGGLKLKRLYRE